MIKTRVFAALALCAGVVAANSAFALAERPTAGGAPPISVEPEAPPESVQVAARSAAEAASRGAAPHAAPHAAQTAAPPAAQTADADAPPPLDLALQADAPVTAAPRGALAEPQTESFERAPHEQALTLRFEDLKAAQTPAPFVRVFVGKGDADKATPVDDPHFAGAVSFFPVPMQNPQEVKINVGPTRDRLRRMGLPADSVTLVLVTPPNAAPSAVDGSGFGAAARTAPSALEPASVRVTRIELEAAP